MILQSELATARLRIRPFEAGDRPALVALFGDPLVARYVDDGGPLDAATAALWIARSSENLAQHGYGTGAVVEACSGAFIGWAGFARPDGGDEELIYGLAADRWGRGYGRELVLALLGFARGRGIKPIKATVHPANAVSIRLLRSAGFRRRSDAPARMRGHTSIAIRPDRPAKTSPGRHSAIRSVMTRKEDGRGLESTGGAVAPVQARRLPSQRHLFSIPRDVAYLNCAYMSPLMICAEEAGIGGLRRKRSPWGLSPADFFSESERARGLFAALIGATAEGIAIVPAVSYGMAVATANLPLGRGQAVVLPAEEFPSAVLAWREAAARAEARIVTVARPDDGDWTSALLGAIDDRTAVVCASQTHWICGGRIDLERIAARCREVEAALVLDLTQSAGALPFDVSAVKPDFAVAACYKWLMGPYSVGFLYVAPQWRAGVPLEQGWVVRKGAEDFRNLIDYKDTYEPGARRFDVGERSNFALMPVACAAIEQLIAWSPERIAATLGDFTERIVEATAALGASAQPRSRRSAHYLGLRFADGLPEDLPARLARHGVHISVRGERLRVTPHLYNDGEDLARLIEALNKELAR